MKRLIPLALCLILVCTLAVPVSADETEGESVVTAETQVDFSTFNFSVTQLTSSSSGTPTYDPLILRSIYYNMYGTNSACITFVSRSYLYGHFWDSDGAWRYGVWTNPIGTVNASLLGVFPLSSLELLDSVGFPYDLFFSKSLAEASPGFITRTCYAVDWYASGSAYTFYNYRKQSINTVWDSSSAYYPQSFTLPSSGPFASSETKYRAASSASVQYNVVPEGGTTSGSGGSGDVDTSTAPYITVSSAASVRRGSFFIPSAELMNPGDITGNISCILSGYNSAFTSIIESTEIANSWVVKCGSDETAQNLTLTFYVDGRPDISVVRTVSVTGSVSSEDDSGGSGAATEPPEPTYSGSEDADDFNESVGDQKGDFDDSMDILDDMTYPSYEDIEIDFSDILDGDAITRATEALAALFDNFYIKTVFFIAFTFALISFVVFGKR